MGRGRFAIAVALMIGGLLAWLGTSAIGGGRAAASPLVTTATTTRTGIVDEMTAVPTPPVLLPTPTMPPPQQALKRVGTLGGDSAAVALNGTLAFVGQGARLVAYDVSNPAQPTNAGALLLPGTISKLRIFGSHAFVAQQQGVSIVDITNPAAMAIVGTVQLLSPAVDIHVIGTVAYVIFTYDILVLDITNIADPRQIGAVNLGPNAAAAVLNTTLYIALGGDLVIFDLSDPPNPVRKGSLHLEYGIYELAAAGTTVLVNSSNKVYFIDVQNPDLPTIASIYNQQSGFYRTGQIVGSLAYVIQVDSTSQMTSTLEVLDISTPAAPVLQSSIDVPGASASLAVAGKQLYVVGSQGLTILEQSSGTPPVVKGQLLGSGFTGAITTDGAQLYTWSGGVLSIYATGDLTATVPLGQFRTPYVISNLKVVGGIAYIAAGSDGGLLTVDVHDGRAPTQLGRLLIPGAAQNVIVAGHLAYVVNGPDGLTIVDVTNPAQPTLRGRFTDLPVFDIRINGTTLYMTYFDGFLHALDVSNPDQPVLLPDVTFDGVSGMYALDANILYVRMNYTDLGLIDVHQPNALALKSTVKVAPTSFLASMVTENGLAYMFVPPYIQVADVHQPENPSVLTRSGVIDFGTSISSAALAVVGDRIYIASGSNGITVLQFDPSVLHPSAALLPIVVQPEPTFYFPIDFMTPTACAGCMPAPTVIPVAVPNP